MMTRMNCSGLSWARLSAILPLTLCLSSCGTQQAKFPVNDAAEASAATTSTVKLNAKPADFADADLENAELDAGAEKPMVFIGSDLPVAMPPPPPPIRISGDAVQLNFEEAPLSDVVHSILGDILEQDYLLEAAIDGNVTIRTRSPIPRDQLLPTLESVLQANGAYMVRGPDNRWFVSTSNSLLSRLPSFQSAPSSGFTNVVIPLQYIGATEMSEILSPVAAEGAFVRVDNRRNLLILAGTQRQLEGWLDIITIFDVDQLAGMSVAVIPLENTQVTDVYTELEQILSSDGQEGLALGGMVKVTPIERLNSLLVVSPRANYLDQVQKWVDALDGIGNASSEPTLYVYPIKNGNASQLASLLSTIFDGQGVTGAGKKQGVAPGLQQQSSGSGGGAAKPSTGGGGLSASAINLGDEIKVVSDDYNNSLLIYAAAQDYRRLERILDKLDVVATQVLIEASIVEVTLIDELEYGLEWAFQNNLGGGDTGTGMLNLTPAGAFGPKVPGFSYTIANSAEAVRVVLNALAEDSLINVISTPSIMVLDNHSASIHVGDQQPVQGQSTITNGGNVQTSIQYKDTGVQLDVKPSVNDGGLVTMEIMQSVTDVGPVDPATKQRSFLERNVSSTIAVRSGESVVLGGLIRDNATSAESGVPFLKDIPGLGALFSSTSESVVRTELLVFITPRVLEGEGDLRAINQEMRDRMKGLTNFKDLPVGFQ